MLIHRTSVGQVIHTPAKINLFFEIAGERDDGFHEVETLMVPIGLYDTLQVRPVTDGKIRLRCRLVSAKGFDTPARLDAEQRFPTTDACSSSPELALGEDNLVVRAILLLRQLAGIHEGADVELVKRIPIAAGLGGGSSDAAAALVAANHLWKLDWSRSQLAEVAAKLGSDIPFFLYGKAAICRGRGEIIEPVEQTLSCPVVVLRPPVGLSTAEVFATYRSKYRSVGNRRDITRLLEAFRKGQIDKLGRSLFNRLEPVAEGICPHISQMAGAMTQEGGVGHQMSGSGSCYFGLFRSWKQARRAAGHLQSKRLGNVYVVQMCQRSHLNEAQEEA